MTDLSRHTQAILEAARQSLTPSRDTIDSLRRSIESQITSQANENPTLLSPALRAIDRASEQTTGLRASRIVGRTREIHVLQECIEELRRGRGSIVALEGQNGLGKSALVAHVAAYATSKQVLVLQGRARSSGTSLGYQHFVDMILDWADLAHAAGDTRPLDRIERGVNDLCPAEEVPEITACLARAIGIELPAASGAAIRGLEGEALERVIQASVRRWLECLVEARPLILSFEDLHWADPATMDLLEAILPVSERHALLVMAAFRPGYPDTSDRLRSHCSSNYALHLRHLELEPLGDLESAELLRSATVSEDFPHAALRVLVDRAGGNPFFLEELLRSMLDAGSLQLGEGGRLDVTSIQLDIPQNINEVISNRVSRLTPSQQHLLKLAAVLGRQFEETAIGEAIEADHQYFGELATDLEALIARCFLRASATHETTQTQVRSLRAKRIYRFEHALTQEALYNSIPEDERKTIHARCAEAIEEASVGNRQDVYALLAYHHLAAGHNDVAIGYLESAGERAAAAAASAEALRLFRQAYWLYAASSKRSIHGHDNARLEANLARALLNRGELPESIEHFNRALRLHRQWVPTFKVGTYAKFALDLPRVLWRLYRGQLTDARKVGTDRDGRVWQLMYNRSRAQCTADAERAFFDVIAAINHFTKKFDPENWEHAVGVIASSGAFFAWTDISVGASRRFLDVAERFVESDVDRFLYEAMTFIPNYLGGRWSPDQDLSPELLEVGLRHGLLWDADVYLGLCCERNIRQGRWDAVNDQIAKLRELGAEWGYEFAHSNERCQTGFSLLEQRRLDEAEEVLESWVQSRTENRIRAVGIGGLAKIKLFRGEWDEAAKRIGQAQRLLSREGRPIPYHASMYYAARLRFAVDQIQEEVTAGQPVSAKLRREFNATARRCAKIGDKLARERSETLGLIARGFSLLGLHREASSRWKRAIDGATDLDALPELARIFRDIASELERTGKSFEGQSADQWLERAQSGFRRAGLEVELEAISSHSAVIRARGA